MRMGCPHNPGSRRPSALTNRLELRGPLGRKISRVVNFHRETRLNALHPFIEASLPHLFDNLRANVIEWLDHGGLHADQIKSVGLLHRLAHLAVLERKYGGLHWLRIGAVPADGAEIAVSGGGGFVVGI